MIILGVSAFYHDSAACIVKDGELVAAAQEERFTRRKSDPSFPENAISHCLSEAGVSAGDVSAVVFYEKPFLKFDRLLESYLAAAPAGLNMFRSSFPGAIKRKLRLRESIARSMARFGGSRKEWAGKILFSEHHLSHAASAFYPSPFESAAILTIDGVGEWATCSIGRGVGKTVELIEEVRFPHSLGLLYSAFTQFLGFRVNSGEYKVMGLAAYGQPVYADLIKSRLVHLFSDGSFHLNMKYFDYLGGLSMTNRHFNTLFGCGPRRPESEVTQTYTDIAASIQQVLEEAVLGLAKRARQLTGESRLCMAGGVALNCNANAKVRGAGYFDDMWIQPAAGDAGGAIGAALAYWHMGLGGSRQVEKNDAMRGGYLGPSFGNEEIRRSLEARQLTYRQVSDDELVGLTAQLLADGKVIGWFQGRAEFGPRALGARSILASPLLAEMKDVVNMRIKKREGFRPFAPSIPAAQAADWFDIADSPYMLYTSTLKNQLEGQADRIPAVVHVDGTSRLQSVSPELNPLFHDLLEAFSARTGVPVLLNTSFNVRGEPIVGTPEDAMECMSAADLDLLVIGSFIVYRDVLQQELKDV